MIEPYIPFVRRFTLPDGRLAEVDSRVYPEITLHELTNERAIHFNVSCRADGDDHRTHVAEVCTTLGEHQSDLAHRLLDKVCRLLQGGTMQPTTEQLLHFEALSPDEVEEWIEEGPR